MIDEKPTSILRLLAYPKEIDKFLEMCFSDRDIYYSARETGIRDEEKQSEVIIHRWDDITQLIVVMEGF
tara:strand:- start:270 stop:476 length:207 start_codon:yes stop_codon:yes gene_type:complete